MLPALLRRKRGEASTASTFAAMSGHNGSGEQPFPYYKDLVAHTGCVNAAAFSRGDGKLLATGGDDRAILLFDAASVERGKVADMAGHPRNIFCIDFSPSNRFVVSSGCHTVVFRHDVERAAVAGTHGARSGYDSRFDEHGDMVTKCCHFPDSDDLFVSSGNDGVILWDARCEKPCMAVGFSGMRPNCVALHPHQANLMVVGGQHSQIGVADTRSLSGVLWRHEVVGTSKLATEVQHLEFHPCGNLLLATSQHRLPQAFVFSEANRYPSVVFRDPEYSNAVTMKAAGFVGMDASWVAAGGDDSNIYTWKVPREVMDANPPGLVSLPPETSDVERTPPAASPRSTEPIVVPHINSKSYVLEGHRSMANNIVRHPCRPHFVACGVEKTVVLWSPFKSHGYRPSAERVQLGAAAAAAAAANPGGIGVVDDGDNSTTEDEALLLYFREEALVTRRGTQLMASVTRDFKSQVADLPQQNDESMLEDLGASASPYSDTNSGSE